MLASVVTALLLASSASHVAAGPLESRHKHIARGYRQDAAILEDYTPYHVRYLALDCQDKHNTTFFDKCCHPLLRWQKLSDRPKECIPSPAASSAAAAAEPTSPPIDEDPIDDECDPEEDPEEECEDETTTTAPAATLASIATSTKAPEPTSTKAPHSEPPVTSAEPTTTHRPSTTRMVTSTVRTSSAEPTTSAAPDNGNTGGELITGGQATWFKQNGGTGACGQKHSDSDNIVAMDIRMYGDENSRSKYCGKSVLITNKKNGKQAKAIVADCCPTCVSRGSLDMSTGLFQSLGATIDDGVFPIEYEILN
ncbi:rare lipoprotein A-like double-psi beta-barrel protein [Ceratobasidium sp. AG-Ba]|nr:rare lipoprotein A-like double-psi beta-barrel protein [Ceratobasidium sp. AG-Ba]